MTIRALLVVPANNSTMEPELRAYCPSIGELAVARVPRPARTLLKEDIPAYHVSTLQAVGAFAGKSFDIIVYGCTAAGFLAGPDGDSAMAQALSQRFGVETVTTARAMVEVLWHEHATRVDVVTPYLDVVNSGLTNFLKAGGIKVNVLNSFRCKTTAELGTIRLEQVFTLAHETAKAEGDALFIACSQLPTYDIITPLRRELQRPVWSSIQATAWAVLTKLAQPLDHFAT